MKSYYDEPFPSDVVDAPRPRLGFLRDRRLVRPAIVAVLLAVASAATGERVLVSPVVDECDSVRAERDRLAARNAADEATLAGYEAFLKQKEDTDRRFAEATAAIPTQAEIASVLGAVRDLATDSQMRLVSFSPAGGHATKEADGLYRIKASAVLRGRYSDLRTFFDSVADFPRLLAVDSFSATRTQASEGSLDATIGLTCFYKALPEASDSGASAER
jgi:Tfp pilus assembly protein PilO